MYLGRLHEARDGRAHALLHGRWSRRRRSAAWALMIGFKPMAETHLLPARVALYRVGRSEHFAATVSSAALLGLLLFLVLFGAAVRARVRGPDLVDVHGACQRDRRPAQRARDRPRVLGAGLGACVRVVRAVLEAEDPVAAVASERKEVLLVTAGVTTVLADVHFENGKWQRNFRHRKNDGPLAAFANSGAVVRLYDKSCHISTLK